MSESALSDFEKPHRRSWKIHLLTAVVLMAQTGLLIPIFMEVYDSDRAAGLVFAVGVYGLLIVGVSIGIVEIIVRAYQRKSVQFIVGTGVVVIGVLFARSVAIKIRIPSNHRQAIRSCVEFAESEEKYHDVRRNPKWYDYHYARRMEGTDEESLLGVGMISPEFARAEATPGPAVPKSGYLFKILTCQGAFAMGGKRNYVVPRRRDGQEGELMTLGYALVAFPSEYSVTGYKTFIINGNGTIYEKDLGPRTSNLPSGMTEFDPDPSWTTVEVAR